MSLERYRQKRHFQRTPEPAGGRVGRDPPAAAPTFVVQLHHATHRHYDFRLQLGGVLKSWAVPKGPSFDPSVKRLAMEVEDHPLDYAGFEGTIPAGEYGAGDVRIFDRGHWATDDDPRAQLRRGRLHFELVGDKLRGAWDLIRTGRDGGKPRWILRKASDEEAGPFEADDLLGDPEEYRPSGRVWHSHRRAARRPVRRLDLPGERAETIDGGFFAPQLCRPVAELPRGAAWIHEPMWDGYRLLAAVAEGETKLWSQDAVEQTDRLPAVAAAIAHLGASSLRLDGELVEERGRTRYVVFDVLHVDGVDLSGCALRDRKRILQAILARRPDPALIVAEFHGGDPGPIFEKALRDGREGIVSKRLDAPYRPGRGGDWRKLRARATAHRPAPRDERVALTHGERVVFPARGITKAEVFAYYERVAPLMLAEIARRPLAVVRCPRGADGACFFQKHQGKGFGPAVLGASIADAGGAVERHLYVEETAGLLQLAQMNVLEIHPWGAHRDDVDHADRLVFDLDPGEGVPWAKVVAAARLLRRTLRAIELESFVRTSGKNGLHVVVPIEPTPWADVKRFARDLAEALARSRPKELVAVAGKERRRGRIFVDYLRNARGATSVASYSLRTTPEASIAWPLSWAQLGRVRGPRAFDLRAAPRLLRRRDPWARMPHLQQRLPRVGD
jgi:bifunctional non-homologous end joining protein LigD